MKNFFFNQLQFFVRKKKMIAQNQAFRYKFEGKKGVGEGEGVGTLEYGVNSKGLIVDLFNLCVLLWHAPFFLG